MHKNTNHSIDDNLDVNNPVFGLVKWFNEKKGFGFILIGNKNNNAFLHVSVLHKCGLKSVNQGDGLNCILEYGSRGIHVKEIVTINQSDEFLFHSVPNLFNHVKQSKTLEQDEISLKFKLDEIEKNKADFSNLSDKDKNNKENSFLLPTQTYEDRFQNENFDKNIDQKDIFTKRMILEETIFCENIFSYNPKSNNLNNFTKKKLKIENLNLNIDQSPQLKKENKQVPIILKSTQLVGRVKFFNISKGYGFVVDDIGTEVFVGAKLLKSLGVISPLRTDQLVKVSATWGKKGLIAETLTFLS